jgi:integrase
LALSINLTRRVRRRKLKSGETIEQTRYVLNWRDPRTGAREQRFFERQKEAHEKRAGLVAAFDRGTYSAERKTLTVGEAVATWLETKRDDVRPITFTAYEFQSRYVVGPLAPSEARRAIIRSGVGARPKGRAIDLLGGVKLQELTTRQIRAWHKTISDEVSVYSANKALMTLKAALALAAEDHEFRPPAMPTGLQRRPERARKAVLTPQEVAIVIAAALGDWEYGVYYAAPFLMGTRPSEHLGLLWEAVDFEANVVRIQRIQLRAGELSEMTKTSAGRRDIPMSPLLREMLLAWRIRCPRKDGELHRVFPALGNLRAWPLPRVNGGGPLIYNNFRARIWAPMLKRRGLPAVTPHSARHSFISTLQAQGVEVGLVAKLAGHKNAVVTLSHYTHAMRGGEDAVKALDRAYAGSVISEMPADSISSTQIRH